MSGGTSQSQTHTPTDTNRHKHLNINKKPTNTYTAFLLFSPVFIHLVPLFKILAVSLRALRLPFSSFMGLSVRKCCHYPLVCHPVLLWLNTICSSGFEAHSRHQLFVDSPGHGSHQSASQGPGHSPAEKPGHAMLLRERMEQESSACY